ncbi:hypothetical protein K435DRAFT_888221 [Dendrothele bispora CBS 962.96]|uniref:Uncharacterized protein n=1 Tax=Dendrothele bispora (strain CBS 962.96) TaxID=1314807 RepID=A0A4S8KRC4_DENBC|nr:hypothetical protein K435DRAFT_888221 [Dendrothele bispora CBS 962.96]
MSRSFYKNARNCSFKGEIFNVAGNLNYIDQRVDSGSESQIVLHGAFGESIFDEYENVRQCDMRLLQQLSEIDKEPQPWEPENLPACIAEALGGFATRKTVSVKRSARVLLFLNLILFSIEWDRCGFCYYRSSYPVGRPEVKGRTGNGSVMEVELMGMVIVDVAGREQESTVIMTACGTIRTEAEVAGVRGASRVELRTKLVSGSCGHFEEGSCFGAATALISACPLPLDALAAVDRTINVTEDPAAENGHTFNNAVRPGAAAILFSLRHFSARSEHVASSLGTVAAPVLTLATGRQITLVSADSVAETGFLPKAA